jgi:hypothetical protein
MKFSTKQLQAIESGKIRRRQLIKAAEKFAQSNLDMDYPHSYIYSLGGLGKTYNVTKAIKKLKIPHAIVSGKISAWGFALMIAVIVHKKKKGVPFRIVVDDCDAILSKDFINTLKNMLVGDKTLKYTMQIAEHYLDSPEKKAAYEHFKKPVGFEVPTDELIFIFTSNFKLPTVNQAQEAESKNTGTAGNQRILDLNAIRTRCKPKDIIFANDQEWWGWLADAVLNDNSVSHLIDRDQQIELLQWMWSNWNRLSGKCLRTINQLADIMKYDEDYIDEWECDYIDHTQKLNNLSYAGL